MAPSLPTCRVAAGALALSFLLSHPVTASAQDLRRSTHVRSDDPTLLGVIQEGMERSTTFREMVTRIDSLPGLVYIVPSRCGTKSALPACLDHNVQTRGGYRLLRVNVMPNESGSHLIALVAHELQHAIEVLSDESATSREAVTEMFRRISSKRSSAGGFETDAALATQGTVFRELRAHRGVRPSPK